MSTPLISAGLPIAVKDRNRTVGCTTSARVSRQTHLVINCERPAYSRLQPILSTHAITSRKHGRSTAIHILSLLRCRRHALPANHHPIHPILYPGQPFRYNHKRRHNMSHRVTASFSHTRPSSTAYCHCARLPATQTLSKGPLVAQLRKAVKQRGPAGR